MVLRIGFLFAVLAFSIFAPVKAQQDELSSLNQRVVRLYGQGKYIAAIKLAERSLKLAESRFGPQHPKVGETLSNLAALYSAVRRYPQAEPLYKRSLAIRENKLGPNHPSVATTLNNLASLYESTGRYSKAVMHYRRTIAILERTLGIDHPRVGVTSSNLAGLYRRGARYAEAELLYKRSLAISRKAFGDDHASVGDALNNLALLYHTSGRNSDSESLYKRSLAIREKALGPGHKSVGQSLNNLAGLYEDQGRYVEAEPLYQRSLSIRQNALGPMHPDVGITLNNLAWLYRVQNRLVEAEKLYKQTIVLFQKVLGPSHSHLGAAVNNLAEVFRAQDRNKEAEQLYERALKVFKATRGPNHPNVATIQNNLAALLASQRRFDEGERLYKSVLAIRRRAFGAGHASVGLTLNNLAGLYKDQGQYAKAEPLFKQSLAIRENALGPDHPNVGTTLRNLAALYKELGRVGDEAKVRARLAQMPTEGTRHLPLFFVTTRERADKTNRQSSNTASASQVVFGTNPTKQLAFGHVMMQVPPEAIRRQGADRAANLRLDRGRAALTTAVVFKRVRHRHYSRQTFTASIRARLKRAALSKNQVLIFIHGFNVDFDETTKRLSQVAFDLEFDGALIAFSWPSLGSQLRYVSDTSRADASVDAFIAFLDQLSGDMPSVTVHIMAHSMGNRILTRALYKISQRPKDRNRPKLGEIILAHADSTTEWCAKLGKARPFVRGITNYANRDDAALRLSSTIRAGEKRCGLDPRGYQGVETVDTTGMGGKRESLFSVMFGAKNHHGVFANDPLLFGDISRLIASGRRPAHKRTPEFALRNDTSGRSYWVFDPGRVIGQKQIEN